MDAKSRLLPRDPAEETAPGVIDHYQERVGNYEWAASTMRPDIAGTIAKLERFLATLSAFHEKELKHLNRYIRGILNCELIPGRRSDIYSNDRG